MNLLVFCCTMTDKSTVFQQKLTLNVCGRLVDLSKPKVMGILNLTPDSFYDGGKHNTVTEALKQTAQMLAEGADFIDLGAYSSRPKAEHISREEELKRLIPVVKALVKEFPEAIFSIDTFRSEIAKAAVEEGAKIINDISAGEMDENMFKTISKLRVPYIIMHMKGTPQTMLQQTDYENLYAEVCNYFLQKIIKLKQMGIVDIMIDPGFGFAKTIEQSYELLNKLDQFKVLGFPVLAGLSRKSMIYKLLETDAEHALNGTTVANTIALIKGANILRVHDVAPAVEAVKIIQKMSGYPQF
ncbi:MAG: dihydropteroate synthase [Daejeonella sp.]